MMFSKYISGLMLNLAYPPEIKKDKNAWQVVLTFEDEESMIDFFREVYKKGVRQGEDLGKLQERSKKT